MVDQLAERYIHPDAREELRLDLSHFRRAPEAKFSPPAWEYTGPLDEEVLEWIGIYFPQTRERREEYLDGEVRYIVESFDQSLENDEELSPYLSSFSYGDPERAWRLLAAKLFLPERTRPAPEISSEHETLQDLIYLLSEFKRERDDEDEPWLQSEAELHWRWKSAVSADLTYRGFVDWIDETSKRYG